jgi:protein-disulfide isomerase
MRKAIPFIVAALAIVGGFFLGKATKSRLGNKEAATVVAPSGDGVERKRVPLAGVPKGPLTAPVTIVEFSDFQCPFCGRAAPTVDQLYKDYPGKIRIYFRHYPLPFHADAPLASQAALAAEAQGKFWEMHDKLFANQQNIKRVDLERYAQEIGLDMAKFKQALDSNAYKGRVDQDMAVAGQIGVDGTPAFFINGRLLSGAQPLEKFKTIVDEELVAAQKLIAKGTPAERLYETLIASAGLAVPRQIAPTPPSAAPKPVIPQDVFKVTVGDAPVKGGKQPKVTLIEYSEFQCPFCGRVTPTVDQILKTYGDDVQVAFKHYPLPPSMHPNAAIAAYASEEARAQGKFWPMHDKLFANQGALGRADLEKYAQEIGLDMAKFKAALDGSKGKEKVDADQAEGMKFGVRGTPSFFVNGRFIRGAQPFDTFKTVIDEELQKADAKLKAGVPRAQLYAAVIKDGLDKAPTPPPPPPRPGEPEAGAAYRAEIGKAPVKGPKDALVTIVQFSDYQCPFCSRVEPTINQVMDAYKGKVRVAWKDLPLPFHPNAVPAALAARAAGEQGKFWEMHDKIFANQQNLDRATFEKYAGELGLNMARFKSALDQQKYKSEIDADAAQGNKIGASGTPAFFVNGVFLSGAQPFDAFKARIDEELKKAEALVAKGTPKAKVYDSIMKTAKTAVAAAPAAAQGGPEPDAKVYKVDPGNSPSKGPKNAPLTVVVFSDFQCPFCSRVEPSLAQLEKDYPGKVRIVWKNFPLDFHPNAKPAANAAHAAGEQGKFWEMHAKLFANQSQLDRATYEKYAQELGLDMAKFKAALDSNKFDSVIAADMKQGAEVQVTGTPATFINGRKIEGASPYETFKKLADQELTKKGTVAERRRRG